MLLLKGFEGTESDDDKMWLSTAEASSTGAEEVASRLRVEVRQGLRWDEATHRRQLAGYVYIYVYVIF